MVKLNIYQHITKQGQLKRNPIRANMLEIKSLKDRIKLYKASIKSAEERLTDFYKPIQLFQLSEYRFWRKRLRIHKREKKELELELRSKRLSK